jgi:hypothetical protein
MRREDAIQASIVEYLETVIPKVFVFAIPNAARRDRNGRAGNAVPGLRPGMPDLGFVWDGNAYFLECKTERGRLSQAQLACHTDMAGVYIPVAVITSIEDTRRVLHSWRIETREAVP